MGEFSDQVKILRETLRRKVCPMKLFQQAVKLLFVCLFVFVKLLLIIKLTLRSIGDPCPHVTVHCLITS